jgi:hypothetical protein
MASFVFISGAGGMAWYWHQVVPLSARLGTDPSRLIYRATNNEVTLFSSLSRLRASQRLLFARAPPCERLCSSTR